MLRNILAATALLGLLTGMAALAARGPVLLPTGWRLQPPQGAMVHTGTMPQGIALSPGGRRIALVESGLLPPKLRIYDRNLHQLQVFTLPGAFGAPRWLDKQHLLVAGANDDSVLRIDLQTRQVARLPVHHGAWPAAIAFEPRTQMLASADDGNGTVTLGSLSHFSAATAISVGAHPADLLFSRSGKMLYVAARASGRVLAIDVATRRIVASIPAGDHPCALILSPNGSLLYVAESDDDAIGVIDVAHNTLLKTIPVGLRDGRLRGYGASPNALAWNGRDLLVSLGAENAIAVIRNGTVVERIPTGWYPSAVAASSGTIFVADGKGERAPANPKYNPEMHDSPYYVAAITIGSLRAIPPSAYASASAETADVIADAMPLWTPLPATRTILRPNGPIKHVIYVIKENRSYDEVLGDLGEGNGDPKLVWFGEQITPNQHALARRFGDFDNAYTDAQVSADGHNWTDAAFANDYVERFWPDNYGGRRPYDFQSGTAPDAPHNGYLWDAAERAHITFRDYGEDLNRVPGTVRSVTAMAGLAGHFDPRSIGWDLDYSDNARYAEWHSEFRQFVKNGRLPQLEIVYFPNDHTAGTDPGRPTPAAYVAENDWAVGRLVQDVSHSRYWKDSAIFILEDDAQNGPDHVSDQRSTFYVASPYARDGVEHTHYSTVSVLHTIELLLGIAPLSIYDATAQPMYSAFAMHRINAAPFMAVKPNVDMNARNARTAYDAAISARFDFAKPDAVPPALMNAILAHVMRSR